MSTKPDAQVHAELDAKFGDGTGFWVAPLSAVADGAASSVTEMLNNGSAVRQSLAGLLVAAAARAKGANGDVTLPVGTADNGNIVAWGIVSHATNALSAANIEHVIEITPIVYNTGYQPVIQAATISISEAEYTGAAD